MIIFAAVVTYVIYLVTKELYYEGIDVGLSRLIAMVVVLVPLFTYLFLYHYVGVEP